MEDSPSDVQTKLGLKCRKAAALNGSNRLAVADHSRYLSGGSQFQADGRTGRFDRLKLVESRQPNYKYARRRPDTQVARDQSRLLKFDSHLDGPLVADSTLCQRFHKAAAQHELSDNSGVSSGRARATHGNQPERLFLTDSGQPRTTPRPVNVPAANASAVPT